MCVVVVFNHPFFSILSSASMWSSFDSWLKLEACDLSFPPCRIDRKSVV